MHIPKDGAGFGVSGGSGAPKVEATRYRADMDDGTDLVTGMPTGATIVKMESAPVPNDQVRSVDRRSAVARRKHSHYFKSVEGLEYIDVYRVIELFGITDHAIGHAIKKLLVAGGRGGGKDLDKDIAEAIDTLRRWQEMRAEDIAVAFVSSSS